MPKFKTAVATPKKLKSKMLTVTLPGKGPVNMSAQEAMLLVQRFQQQGQLMPMVALLQSVVAQLPSFLEAWLQLLAILNSMSNFAQLAIEAERCLAIKPRFVPAINALAVARRMSQQHDEALMLMDKACKLEPANAELHNHRGIILKELGRTVEALKSFSRSLALNPKNTHAIWNRSDLITTLSEKEYQRCSRLAENTALNANQRAMLHYALARSDAANGDFESEFTHVEAGARLKRSLIHYDHQAEISEMNKIADFFTAAPENPTKAIPSAVTPIFICGLPRSGTTLLEQILSSHPSVMAGDELNDLPLATSYCLQAGHQSKPFPDWAADLTEKEWQTIGGRYLETTAHLHGQGWFTDKNLQNYKAVGVIRRALPQAKIVICRRNPMDNLWGCYKQYFGEGLKFTYSQTELAETWRACDALIKHWQATGNDVHIIEYEKLVAEPEAIIRQLLDFVGLPWNEACLNFHANARAVRTNSATQVRQPLSTQRIDQWRNYEQQLQPMWNALSESTD